MKNYRKILDFLGTVLPPLNKGERYSTSFRYSPEIDPTGTMHPSFFTSLDEMARACATRSEMDVDLYYCICTLSHPRRIRQNCLQIKEFAFDIDIKSVGEHYKSIEEAIIALTEFINVSQIWSTPYIVLTGGGLQCHWVFDAPITREQYIALCDGIKDQIIHTGFKVDLAAFGNSVQILRVPCSNNYKYSPARPVYAMDNTDFHTISFASVEHLYLLGLEVSLARKQRIANLNLTPGKVDLLSKHCLAAQELVKDGGTKLAQGAWRGVGSNARACEGGEDWFHHHSSKYPGYTPEETQKILNNAASFTEETGNYLTCEYISQSFPRCKECKFWGVVRKPVELTQQKEEDLEDAPDEVVIEQAADGNMLYDGTPIITRPFAVHGYCLEQNTKKCSYLVQIGDGQEYLPASKLKDYKAMEDITSKYGATIKDPHKNRWYNFATQEIMRADGKELGEMTMVLGWNEDFSTFRYGNYHITDNGIKLLFADNSIEPTIKAIRPLGDRTSDNWYINTEWFKRGVENQQRALAPFFQPGFEHQAVVVLAGGWAPPFWELYDKEHGGLILSLTGTRSGTGKTTAMQAALSLWAPWEALMLHNSSSVIQHAEKLGVLKNFPVGVDESYHHDIFKVMEYCQQFTVGRPKDRLDQTGAMKHHKREWHTTMTHTSNRSMLNTLLGRADSIAMCERIVELQYDTLPCLQVNNELVKTLAHNCGFIGPWVMTQILRDHRIPELQASIAATVREIGKTNIFTHANRFKVTSLAVTTVMAQVLLDYGVFNFDLKHLMDYYSKIIQKSNNAMQPIDIALDINGFLSLNLSRIEVEGKYIQGVIVKDPIALLPKNSNTVVINYQVLAEYLAAKGYGMQEVLNELVLRGKSSGKRKTGVTSHDPRGISLEVEVIDFILTPEEVARFR